MLRINYDDDSFTVAKNDKDGYFSKAEAKK